MKNKKILKTILIYLVFIYCGIWLNNVIQDKDLYNGILNIFTRYDYRAINFVFLIYQYCTAYCIFESIRFIVNKLKRKKVVNNDTRRDI